MEASTSPQAKRKEHVLVVANETVGGRRLLEAIKHRAEQGAIHCTVICPQNKPRRGFVIYGDTVRSAATVRLELMLKELHELGIEARGEVMDPDPYLATTDAIRIWNPDEIIVSTHAYTHSGFWRRDLVDRIRDLSGLPVEHVAIDLEHEGVKRVLVVANRTVGGNALLRLLERLATEEPHTFTIILPQSGADRKAFRSAKRRLETTLEALDRAGVDAAGQVMESDPVTAVRYALQSYPADMIVVSTLPKVTSGWLRGHVVDHIRRASGIAVEHVIVDLEAEDSDSEVEV